MFDTRADVEVVSVEMDCEKSKMTGCASADEELLVTSDDK